MEHQFKCHQDFSSETTETKNKSGTVFFKYWEEKELPNKNYISSEITLLE
jgi:hypothetical protein